MTDSDDIRDLTNAVPPAAPVSGRSRGTRVEDLSKSWLDQRHVSTLGQDDPERTCQMLRHLNPEGVAAPGMFSHAVEATAIQRTLFLSGQVGRRPDGSLAEGVVDQTRVAIGSLSTILADAGMQTSDIVKLTLFLTDEDQIDGFREAGGELLPTPPPAMTLVFVKALAAPELLVEIEAIAVK